MNCLLCGGVAVERGSKWSSWDWECNSNDCFFAWDSEYGDRKMSYILYELDSQGSWFREVPKGTLAVFNWEEI